MSLLLALACASEPDPAGCARYADTQPETYGFCLSRHAQELPDAAAVEAVCGEAGRWEESCRTSWVTAQHLQSRVLREDTLVACGRFDACGLELLDFRPSNDLQVQIDRCRRHAGVYTHDCVGHAYGRWIATNPGEEEIAAARAAVGDEGRALGAVLGLRVVCGRLGSCDGTDAVAQACRDVMAGIGSRPGACEGQWPPRAQ